MKKTLSVLLVICFLMSVTAAVVSAQTSGGFDATPGCTTDPTGIDGVRHSCDLATPYTITAPDGQVIDYNSVKIEETSAAGSEHSYSPNQPGTAQNPGYLTSWISIIPHLPDVKYPKTFQLYVHARGPTGHSSGRGWAYYHVSGKFLNYT